MLIRNIFSSREKSLAICFAALLPSAAPLQRFWMFVACLRRHSEQFDGSVQSTQHRRVWIKFKVFAITYLNCAKFIAYAVLPAFLVSPALACLSATVAAAVYANLCRCSITLSSTIDKLWRLAALAACVEPFRLHDKLKNHSRKSIARIERPSASNSKFRGSEAGVVCSASKFN